MQDTVKGITPRCPPHGCPFTSMLTPGRTPGLPPVDKNVLEDGNEGKHDSDEDAGGKSGAGLCECWFLDAEDARRETEECRRKYRTQRAPSPLEKPTPGRICPPAGGRYPPRRAGRRGIPRGNPYWWKENQQRLRSLGRCSRKWGKIGFVFGEECPGQADPVTDVIVNSRILAPQSPSFLGTTLPLSGGPRSGPSTAANCWANR